MPRVRANGIDIHYELHGAGEPVVLIGGLGADTFLWFRQIPDLSRHFQVIAFDNRGAGESDKPDEPYSIRTFADDTAGLLKGLGIARTHVVGASMGGFIAQELALSYPEMVNRLVLAATAFGGPHSVPASPETVAAMMQRTGDPEVDLRNSFALFTNEQWRKDNPRVVDEYVIWRVAHPQPVAAYQRQAQAAFTFNAEERVSQITAPTLIIHGEEDRVVPVENARLLAGRIPGAKLLIFPNCGHAFTIEQPEKANDAITRFLKGQ